MRGTVLVAVLLIFLCSLPLRAETVRDLHSAQVPVADQGNAALAAAARAAMAEVVVKVSGSPDVLDYPAIATALRDARSHVQQYSYRRGTTPEEGLSARFEFDPTYITGLIREAEAPLWTANRPVVLAWLVLEGTDGRQFVSAETHPEETRLLIEAFSRRGVPLQLPLFDLADTAALSPDDVWRLDGAMLQAASERYGARDILAGRITPSSAGRWLGDWSYLHVEERIDRAVTAPDLEGFLADGAGIVAGSMSARYAFAATGAAEGGVLVTVDGVDGYAAYAGIVSWLEQLELVEHANLESISGERIELRLHTQADAAQLASIIELNTQLLPLVTDPLSNTLGYQWRK